MRNALVLALALLASACATDPDAAGTRTDDCAGAKCDVWGTDERADLYAAPPGIADRYGHGVGVLMDTATLDLAAVPITHRTPTTLDGDWGLCPDQRFAEQPTVSYCSGFLAAPDVFVTAAHCLLRHPLADERGVDTVDPAEACARTAIVFDHGYFARPIAGAPDPLATLDPATVFRCAAVEAIGYQRDGALVDYAVLRLDRAVTDRAPLAYRTSGTLATGAPVFAIGGPSGLPLKYAGGAHVQAHLQTDFHRGDDADDGEAFGVDLDSFGGNSGGPLFDARTGEVVGLVVTGAGASYHERLGDTCYEAGVCGVNADCAYYSGIYPTAAFAGAFAAAR